MNNNKPTTLITGAGQGIGAAIAKRLAKAGHNIALNYFSSKEAAFNIAKECEGLGSKVLLLQADISNPAECRKTVNATITELGKVDLLVNNAAVASFSQTEIFDIESQSLDSFNTIFNTNVLGALALSQAVIPHMKAIGQGAIINISSAAGINGITNSSIIYAASKGALNTLTLSLSKALSPHIRVNAICPAMVDSSWWIKKFPEEEKRIEFVETMKKKNPFGSVIMPEDVANAVLFIYENKCINGELIRMDSGLH